MSEIIYDENLWRPIPGYYPYEAYPTGEIRNTITGFIVSQSFVKRDGRGCNQKYLKVNLRHEGKQTQKLVHRLIAMTFLPRPKGNLDDYEVDHLDHDPTNNDFMNLRWLPKRINHMLQPRINSETRRRIVEEYARTL